MRGVVVDASAIIAFLRREPGAEVVRKHLHGACMSAVNACEVLEHAPKHEHSPDKVRAFLRNWHVDIVPFDMDLATIAARLKSSIDPKADVSLADRVCLSLAIARASAVVTADRSWKTLDVGCKVILIRGDVH